MRRLERPTSTSRTWRASQLCYIPFFLAAKVQIFRILQNFFLFSDNQKFNFSINPVVTNRNK